MEGGCDRRLMGQTGILALDGVRMLVGIAAIVVATSIPRMEEVETPSKKVLNKNKINLNTKIIITHAPLCRQASAGWRMVVGVEDCPSYRTAAVRPLEWSRWPLSLCM